MRYSIALSILAAASSAAAQDATIVYRLGKDTVAVEQYTRSSSRLTGELVTRGGATVIRTTYDYTLRDGRITGAVVKRMGADGNPLPNAPLEYRFITSRDTVHRDVVWRDSTQRRTYIAPNAFFMTPVFAYGPMEVLAAMGKGRRDSVPAISFGGNALGYVGLTTVSGDTLRMRGQAYDMVLAFDRQGRLQTVDGSLTTNKSMGMRTSGKVDIAALARTMKPSGQLSPRMYTGMTFNQGPIMISYGQPSARGRTVWGGTLVPFDSIWRTGANEATHLATSKIMQFGDLTLPPGVYTLWTQHTRTGTWLIVNKQVGQWGTIYNPANDIGRVQMEMKDITPTVEELAIAVRSIGQGRGAIDIAWGDRVATATFQVRNQ